MPRRTKEDSVTDTSPDAATAGGSEPAAETETTASEEKPSRKRGSALDEMPLGPTKTRTGAEATVIQGPNGKRVFTAGGDKGGKIAELLRTRNDLSRKDIAAMVGCSQSRVAEVARVLGLATARPAPSPPAENGEKPAETESPTEATQASAVST